jgi:WD40 repeat protein
MVLTATAVSAEPTANITPTHVIELRPPGKKRKEPDPVDCVAFHPDGKTAYFGGGNGNGPGVLSAVDVKTGKTVWSNADHKQGIRCVAVSSDGKQIVTGAGCHEVKVWDVDGKLTKSLTLDWEHTNQVVFSPDGKWLAVSGDWLNVFDTSSFERVHDETKKGQFGMLGAFTPDSKSLIGSSAAAPGTIQFMTVGEWKLTEHKSKVEDLGYYHPALSSDGQRLATGTLRFRRFADDIHGTEVWAVKDGKLGEKVADIPDHCLGCSFTPDSKHLLLGEMRGEKVNRIRVYEASTGKEIGSWVVTTRSADPRLSWAAGIDCLAVSPDGKTLASCDRDHAGKLWDLETILSDIKKAKDERK